MADTPPRRSRRPTETRKDATFPLIPFLIGVVILGFVIGAGLSMAGRHGSSPQVAAVPVATEEPTATLAPTLAPLATARPIVQATATATVRDETVSPEPSALASPSAKPKPKPSVTHVALASSSPSAAPSVAPSVEPTALATATPAAAHTHHATSVAVAKTATPAAIARTPAATSAPATSAANATTAAVAPSVAPTTSIEADSDFGRLSANVVRQYLRALARGDTESAAGAFPPGTPNLTFPEQPILDSSATIGTISARGSSQTQTVNASISTANGNYTGTYTVQRTSTGAAVIVSHSLNKG